MYNFRLGRDARLAIGIECITLVSRVSANSQAKNRGRHLHGKAICMNYFYNYNGTPLKGHS